MEERRIEPEIGKKFDEVIASLSAIKSQKKASLEAMAQMIGGISKTQLSDLLAGKMFNNKNQRNISDALIIRLYEMYCKREKPIQTATFEKISNILKFTRENSAMTGVAGRTGLGKSVVCRDFLDANPGTYYIQVSRLMDVASIWERIYTTMAIDEEITVKSSRKRRLMIIDKIQRFAMRSTSKLLLIIDDAHHANGIAFYQDLYYLREATKGMMGIALVGTELLDINLKKYAGFDREMNRKYKVRCMMDEFHRRFAGNIYSMSALSFEDIKVSCENFGITSMEVINWLAFKENSFKREKRIIRDDIEMDTLVTKLKLAIQMAGSADRVNLNLLKSL